MVQVSSTPRMNEQLMREKDRDREREKRKNLGAARDLERGNKKESGGKGVCVCACEDNGRVGGGCPSSTALFISHLSSLYISHIIISLSTCFSL